MIDALVISFLYDALKKGFINLIKTHPVNKSVHRLNEKYNDIENLQQTLELWLVNEDVKNTIAQLLKGKSKVNTRELAKLLVQDGGFYFKEETAEKSFCIINDFFLILNEEFIKDNGLLYHDYKEEERNKRVLEEIRKSEERLELKIQRSSAINTQPSAGSPLIDELREKFESQFTSRINEARKFLLIGKVITAKKLYETLKSDLSKEREPLKKINFRAFTNLGCCELELGNFEKAIEYFEQAHNIFPLDPISLANIAEAKRLRGNIKEGLQYIDKLLEKCPKHKLGVCIKTKLLTDD